MRVYFLFDELLTLRATGALPMGVAKTGSLFTEVGDDNLDGGFKSLL